MAAARQYLPPQSQRQPQFWRPVAARLGESLASRASLAVDADGADADVSIASLASPFVQSGREKLPVFKHREAILYLVETHAVSVVVGETGSGKTTQIPQYLVAAGWAAGGRVVACTQPRRVAAQVSGGSGEWRLRWVAAQVSVMWKCQVVGYALEIAWSKHDS
ncbi:unnamed protein product [Closterium sp. Yama58-4]|nr:unnamed protein product [Closterium sp. Yama58-4]